ncbi:MAG TPA: hypothetical protein VFE48_22335 [Methylomirabilota bacterium]|nr:hypothetical protein [Methylomirabilota bacterium]
MTCDACGREHEIRGSLIVDDLVIPPVWVEVLVEIMCKRGKLGHVTPQDLGLDPGLVEPDEPRA